MYVDLKDILDQTLNFDFTIGSDDQEANIENEEVQGIGAPLEVHITLSKVGSKVLLDGRIGGSVSLRCHRCLEPFDYDVSSEFRLYLAPPADHPDDKDVGLTEEDMAVSFYGGEGVELYEAVREQIYLTLPVKSLCREDCKGLCPVCGVNRNTRRCECGREDLDDRFSKLKNLKVRG